MWPVGSMTTCSSTVPLNTRLARDGGINRLRIRNQLVRLDAAAYIDDAGNRRRAIAAFHARVHARRVRPVVMRIRNARGRKALTKPSGARRSGAGLPSISSMPLGGPFVLTRSGSFPRTSSAGIPKPRTVIERIVSARPAACLGTRRDFGRLRRFGRRRSPRPQAVARHCDALPLDGCGRRLRPVPAR